MFSYFINSLADFLWTGLDLDYKCSTIYVLVPSRASKAPSQCKVTHGVVGRALWPPKQRWVCTAETILWHPYSDKVPTDENRLDSIWTRPDFYLYTHTQTCTWYYWHCQCVTYIPHLCVMTRFFPSEKPHLTEVLFAFSDVQQAQRTRWDFLELKGSPIFHLPISRKQTPWLRIKFAMMQSHWEGLADCRASTAP